MMWDSATRIAADASASARGNVTWKKELLLGLVNLHEQCYLQQNAKLNL
jgi:hypothetical protein